MAGCDSFNVQNVPGCGVNPCRVTQTNTAACESLPSQISNFTLQFFGEIFKTEINGVVSWSLPCSLDTGLPNNPRAASEGLACYFLRLFADGIVGLTGPKGNPGDNGVNGNNAYTVTIQSFTQPTLAAPHIQVLTSFNPVVLADLYVFVQGSGWYSVDDYDTSGMAFLTLARPLANVSGTVPAGRLVLPAGFPGESITGPQGPQGPKGEIGAPGESFSATNDFYGGGSVGTNYALQVVYSAVDFTNSAPNRVLPVAGTYLLTAVVDYVGAAGVLPNDIVSLKLRNTSIGGDVGGSEHIASNIVPSQHGSLTLNAIYVTSGANQTVAVFGKCTTANAVDVDFARTTFSIIRLS